MSDEEDYMSDKFLEDVKKHKAPSLINRPQDKREMEVLKKKAALEAKMKERKSARVLEEENREEGLSSAIPNNNKGFKLLMKMGYKPGKGIGKEESGISEPINVGLKNDRHGLGKVKAYIKKKSEKQNSDSKLDELNTNDFRHRLLQKRLEKIIAIDLRKSQRICENLDMKQNIEKPIESWFWCTKDIEEEKSEESDESQSEEEDEKVTDCEKLDILTKYLRDKYSYCIWCGVAYDNADDLRDSCPGSTRDDH